MTALFIQKDYIKIDCDKCGAEVCLIEVVNPQHDNDTVKKEFRVLCKEHLK